MTTQLRALINARLIDGTGGPARERSTVIIDGERIVEVTEDRPLPVTVEVVDLGGATLMPGLIDCHTHHAAWAQSLVTHPEPLGLLMSQTVAALKTTVEAGITTARDLGGLERGFVLAVDRGVIPGPRLQTSLIIVSPTNSLMDAHPVSGGAITSRGRYEILPGLPEPWCDGPVAARAKVREVIRMGADVIKVAMTGSMTFAARRPNRPLFTPEELAAIVDEAHLEGIPVCAHAHGDPGAILAVRAGVDTIEHGTYLTEECAREMADRGTWYVPTMCISNWHSTLSQESVRAHTIDMPARHRESLALAVRFGVRIAAGTDTNPFHGFGRTGMELELLVEAGMTSAEAIRVATDQSSQCMGVSADVGTVAAGKFADLLIVDGDPHRDIRLLQDAKRRTAVLKGGQFMSGSLLSIADAHSRHTMAVTA
ncbi:MULTISPECIES: amidohydrolase family protein [unclassified Cryobacterium]|uniref:metal-dependent hydrolase family protein n=1 Tax=unclassified Cryobacterium TaxID=2649013 RepID=UPI000CE34C58|nr:MULTISPECIES: amidohydrolase family protein [unclassified Cryobacterium]